jgi:O-methyltransferase
VKSAIKKLIHPLRVMAGKFAIPERSFIGAHGCLQTGASFVAWNQIDGDYLEFGVYRGGSFIAAYHAMELNRRNVATASRGNAAIAQWLAQRPRLFAFDSFAGLPGGEAERQSDYGEGAYACSEDEFRRNVRNAGVDMSRVITVPGMYDQSLTAEAKRQHGLRQAAMIMIDCDLYESTVPVLEFITDLVGQGTILVFHDWFRFKGSPQQGEQRACREWLERNPQLELIEYWREGPQAVAFLVNFK